MAKTLVKITVYPGDRQKLKELAARLGVSMADMFNAMMIVTGHVNAEIMQAALIEMNSTEATDET